MENQQKTKTQNISIRPNRSTIRSTHSSSPHPWHKSKPHTGEKAKRILKQQAENGDKDGSARNFTEKLTGRNRPDNQKK